MIEVDRRLYKETKQPGHVQNNMLYFSPWTGATWAILDFGFVEWQGHRLSAPGERSYLEGHPPGSLFMDYDRELIECLPRELLIREISILVDLRSDRAPVYNVPQTQSELQQMSPKLMDEIAQMRTKVLSKTITDDELRQALRLMRADRVTATQRVASSKAAKAPVDPDKAIDAIFG